MKKSIGLLLLFVSFFFVLTNNMLVLADNITYYTVYSVKKDGTKTQIGEVTDNYENALKLMNEYNNKVDDVAVIYKNEELVNAYYGMVKLNSYVLNIYADASLSTKLTYTHGEYGKDALFIDYEPKTDTYKIKISGCVGYINRSNASLKPISSLATDYVTVINDGTKLYSANSNGYVKRTLQHNAPYIYVEKALVNDAVWYHLKESGIDGWVKGTDVSEEIIPYTNTFYVRFNMEDNNKAWDLYHYYEYGNNKVGYVNLGIAPNFMTKNKYYYSFDGNYFYDDFIKMLIDHKNNTYENSVNKDNPYFNYYLYLPNHSLSSYSASDFDSFISINYNAKPDKSYVDENGNFTKPLESNLSQLYGEGKSYFETQNEYGVNALLTFAVSKNESGDGRSAIAIAKNNIFGHNAVDSAAFKNATTYDSVKDSIIAHATKYVNAYVYPTGYYYNGGHYGNKGSGMNINYASDPYWGEKMANRAYLVDISIVRRTYTNKLENFTAITGQDYLSNTIGVKLSNEVVEVKKSASNDSETLYTLNNKYSNVVVNNVPLIVVDKLEKDGKYWYKVRTDIGLDEKGNFTENKYNFNTSYGYVLSDYLYVSNNQPTIKAESFKIDQGSTADLLKYASATDLEDGDISSKITYSSNLNINVPGVYSVTYTVSDSSNFSVSKSVSVKVIATSTPVISATDLEIKQYNNFNPLEYVSASDGIDGDISNKVKIVSSNLDVNKVGTYQIKYSVTNSLNVTVEKIVKITVLSNSKPVIYANDIYVNKNSTITFKENVQARDLEDGLLDVNVLSNTTDLSKVGTYDLTLKAVDSDNNEVTKSVKVYVSDNLETLKGEFYFNTLKWNNDTNMLDISGSLAMIGIDNLKETNIKYYLVLKNNSTSHEIVMPLSRYLENHPDTVYIDTSKKYLETWFKGSVSLSSVEKGEYTLYVMARTDKYETKEVISNLFLKPYTRKATDTDGRGYLFRNDNYKREFPMELIIENTGLISKTEPTHSSNMFNTFDSIVIKDKYLNITGNSFNMGVDYNKNKSVLRFLILEESVTEKRYVYDVGSIIGDELSLKSDDGLSKARSWYKTDGLIDLSNIPKGNYIIYLRSSVDGNDDFGELQDIFIKVNQTVKINDKTYTLSVNKNARYRIELNVK